MPDRPFEQSYWTSWVLTGHLKLAIIELLATLWNTPCRVLASTPRPLKQVYEANISQVPLPSLFATGLRFRPADHNRRVCAMY